MRVIYSKPLRRQNVLFLHNAIRHIFTKAQDRIMFRSHIKCHNFFTHKVSYNILYVAALVKAKTMECKQEKHTGIQDDLHSQI